MKTKRIDLSKSKTFIENLRKILDILPTEDEKNEINNNFEVIIKFLLLGAQNRLTFVPAQP